MDAQAPLVSIQIPSNRPEKILIFLDHLEKTTENPQLIEVIVNLDKDDTTMSQVLDAEKVKRPFVIKYIKTFTGGFYNSWKPINDMLEHAHPNAYFLTFLSDEFLFQTKGWDNILKTYIGYYSDNVFRLRASQFRFRNYIDFWECGFAPDSITFYTKKWIDINKDWGPCFSSDAFQQCVAYYLASYDSFAKEQDNRDIPIPHIQFSGEGASIGLEGEKARERVRGGLKAWFILTSYKIQTEALRRAMLLKAYIVAKQKQLNYRIVDNEKKKEIYLIDRRTKVVNEVFSYRLSRWKIFVARHFRKLAYLYYCGGGKQANKNHTYNVMRFHMTYYLSLRYKLFSNLHDQCNYIESVWKARWNNFKKRAYYE